MIACSREMRRATIVESDGRRMRKATSTGSPAKSRTASEQSSVTATAGCSAMKRAIRPTTRRWPKPSGAEMRSGPATTPRASSRAPATKQPLAGRPNAARLVERLRPLCA